MSLDTLYLLALGSTQTRHTDCDSSVSKPDCEAALALLLTTLSEGGVCVQTQPSVCLAAQLESAET